MQLTKEKQTNIQILLYWFVKPLSVNKPQHSKRNQNGVSYFVFGTKKIKFFHAPLCHVCVHMCVWSPKTPDQLRSLCCHTSTSCTNIVCPKLAYVSETKSLCYTLISKLLFLFCFVLFWTGTCSHRHITYLKLQMPVLKFKTACDCHVCPVKPRLFR